jgi:hypothetical protein
MPLLVISSRAVGLMTTRSPSGWSFDAVAVALAKVLSSCGGQGRPSGVIGGAIDRPERDRFADVPGALISHLVEPV